ncbi:MAG TPA: chemotaxis protein CheD [Nitrospirota bacterium]
MNLTDRDLPVVYLKPGDMYFAKQPTLIVTVLGSCLSITMFNRRRGLGSICHGLLPKCGPRKKDCQGECLEGFRYVDCSIRRMVQLFDRHKVKRSEIEIKCFGGADMFTRTIELPGIASIGRQNVTTAKQILKDEGLKLRVIDVGGLQGRKIFFNTRTGEVLLKRLHRPKGE